MEAAIGGVRTRHRRTPRFLLQQGWVWGFLAAVVATLPCTAGQTPTATPLSPTLPPSPAPTVSTSTVRVGLFSSNNPISDYLAAFLLALRWVNADPAARLGASSVRAAPVFVNAVAAGLQDGFKVGEVRSMGKLLSGCNSSDGEGIGVVGAALRGLDAQLAVSAGASSVHVRASVTADILGKPVIAVTSTSDALSDKRLFPTYSRTVAPDRYQSRALAHVVSALGWSRVGVLVATEAYGTGLAEAFTEACTELGVAVVATVSYDPAINLATDLGRAAVDSLASSMEAQFGAANVSVYLFAAASSDVHVGLTAMNQSGYMGGERVVLAPDGVVSRLSILPPALTSRLNGSIGVFPDFDAQSAVANTMFSGWPSTQSEWTELLSDLGATAAADHAALPLPTQSRAALTPFAYYTWDGAIFAAKALTTATAGCPESPDRAGGAFLDPACLLGHIRNTTYTGSTGRIELDANGDRFGAYGVYSVQAAGLERRGRVDESNGATTVTLDVPGFVWSDGVSGRTSGPQWGQILITPPPTVAPSDDDSTGLSWTTYALVALASLVLIAILIAACRSRRNRLKLHRREKALVHYIRVLCDVTPRRGSRDRAIMEAYRHVSDVVDAYIPAEAGDAEADGDNLARPTTPNSLTKAARRSMAFVGLIRERRTSSPTLDEGGAVDVAQLTAALFIAIDLDRWDLIPPLVKQGANVNRKHPFTGRLPVSQVLSATPSPATIPEALLHLLLHSGTFEVDDTLNQLLAQDASYVQLVDDQGDPVVLEPDPRGGHGQVVVMRSRSASSGSSTASHPSAATNVLPGQKQRRTSFRPVTAAKKSKSKSGHGHGVAGGGGGAGGTELANREDEGLVTASYAVRLGAAKMAQDGWRSPTGDTIIHRVLSAVQLGRLREKPAMDLIDAILDAEPGLLTRPNAAGVTPDKLASLCHGCALVKATFNVVLFRHFELVHPAQPLYKSHTTLIHEVRDLWADEDTAAASGRLVIKLMAEEDCWRREIEGRERHHFDPDHVVPVLAAATVAMEHPSARLFRRRVAVERYPGLVRELRQPSAKELHLAYPHAIILPLADRDLGEVITNERLAGDELDTIRSVASQLCATVQTLHRGGVVHCDVNPGNFVRKGRKQWMLIDMDLSFDAKVDPDVDEDDDVDGEDHPEDRGSHPGRDSAPGSGEEEYTGESVGPSRDQSDWDEASESGGPSRAHSDSADDGPDAAPSKPRRGSHMDLEGLQTAEAGIWKTPPKKRTRRKRSVHLAGEATLVRRREARRARVQLSHPDKLASGYCSPELMQYIAAVERGVPLATAKDAVADALVSPFQIDLWTLGASLFEMVTGRPLVDNVYGEATDSGREALLNWAGLSRSQVELVERTHGKAESTALVDLLQWLLDADPVNRPKSMTLVLDHLFFNHKTGLLRENAVIATIRSRLCDRSAGPRLGKSVMISYCWADTPFVLNKLALELASVVDDLWLDRLGGENGMGEWIRKSMERGVSRSDVIVAVVSKDFVRSENCGYEMGLAARLNKTLIPVRVDPTIAWPPVKIGSTPMSTQFIDPDSGDIKLYIDCSQPETFALKFRTELLPRILKPGSAVGGGPVPRSASEPLGSAPESPAIQRRANSDGLPPADSPLHSLAAASDPSLAIPGALSSAGGGGEGGRALESTLERRFLAGGALGREADLEGESESELDESVDIEARRRSAAAILSSSLAEKVIPAAADDDVEASDVAPHGAAPHHRDQGVGQPANLDSDDDDYLTVQAQDPDAAPAVAKGRAAWSGAPVDGGSNDDRVCTRESGKPEGGHMLATHATHAQAPTINPVMLSPPGSSPWEEAEQPLQSEVHFGFELPKVHTETML